jgi:hypothetical protein
MSRSQFAFLHIGAETATPTILVRSIRAHNPDATIIQCSDPDSPEIAGVDRVFRSDKLDADAPMMTARLQCFAELDVTAPTLFLDTDMMCLARLDPSVILEDSDVAVCRREFETGTPFNLKFMDLDFGEYAGKLLGEIYPYVASATITRTSDFWNDALQMLRGMDPKFHVWFGDQEAIRDLVAEGKYRVGFLRESVYSRLADLPVRIGTKPKIYHFKGAARKPIMLELARKAGYV